MIRKGLASFVMFAALSTVAVVAQTPAIDSTGNWSLTNSGDNFGSTTASIKQVGSQVVGTLGSGAQFNGTFKAGTNQVDGNWKSPKGTGWITLTFVDSNNFSGDWGYGGQAERSHRRDAHHADVPAGLGPLGRQGDRRRGVPLERHHAAADRFDGAGPHR